jgi:hypothetical protein
MITLWKKKENLAVLEHNTGIHWLYGNEIGLLCANPGYNTLQPYFTIQTI